MRFLHRGTVVLIMAGTCAGCVAQEQPRPSEFSQLFPHPTGQNGYEELVAAAEICRGNATFSSYWSGEADNSLSAKRVVLRDPQVQRALAILRQGLNKSRSQIHANVDPETRFPELALFRLLARLLMLEQYVLLADGNVASAIDTLRDTLRLGVATRGDTNTIISGLVQVAIDAIGLKYIGDHLGQLSARDCDRLLAVAREWVAEPDPTVTLFESERRLIAAALDKAKTNPDDIFALLTTDSDTTVSAADIDERLIKRFYREQVESALTTPGAYASLIDSVKVRSMARIDSQIAAQHARPWERAAVQQPTSSSLAGYLAESMVPALDHFADRFVAEQTTARLIGLHAAIRRYLWEHDRLPERLEDLRARDLFLDPFTGGKMLYNRTGERTYELSSAGPYGRDDDGKPTSKREPITVPRAPK
jgi:hypothetical protein